MALLVYAEARQLETKGGGVGWHVGLLGLGYLMV